MKPELPLLNGKINKRELLRSVIREELEAGRSITDNKRIRLIAMKRAEAYPKDARTDFHIGKNDVNNAKQHLNKGERKSATAQPAEYRTGDVSPAVPTTSDSVTFADLRNAKAYLASCSGSLVKARQLLDFLVSLQGE